MMMKQILLLVCLCVSAVCSAQPVSRQQALERARGFMQQYGVLIADDVQPLSRRLKSSQQDLLYVFNTADEGGFVVMSGDERAEAVLGYSLESSYDADNLSPGFEYWMETMAKQIEGLREGRLTPVRRKANYAKIEPLIKTKWNQGAATTSGKWYNTTCPMISGKHCLTGCVATAMAQLMYYYRWPQDKTFEVPAYDIEGAAISHLDALPPVQFDWANMTLTYSASSSAKQIQAVSTLMRYCGQAAHMNYGLSWSAASNWTGASNMVDCFDYDPYSWHCVVRNNYTDEEWESLMYSELAVGRPVLYSGQKATPNNGHAFLLDGNSGGGYWHFNWGWGGDQDGYYLMAAANGYSYDQDAVIGLQRNRGDKDAGQKLILTKLTLVPGTQSTWTITVKNVGKDTYNDIVILYLYDYENGSYFDDKHSPLLSLKTGESATFEVKYNGLTAGSRYYLTVEAYTIGYEMESLYSETFTMPSTAEKKSRLSKIDWSVTPYETTSCTATVMNVGDAPFTGSFWLILWKKDSATGSWSYINHIESGYMTLQEGETYSTKGSFPDMEVGGTYQLALRSFTDGGDAGDIIYEIFTVRKEPTLHKLTYMVDGALYKAYDVMEGDRITSEPKPEREGFNFEGWVGEPSVMPDHDVTVTGTFIKIPQTTTVTIPATGVATFYDSTIPYILPSGLRASVVTAVSDSKLQCSTIADGSDDSHYYIPAGVAVMLETKNKNAGTYTLTEEVHNPESLPTYEGTNLLRGSDTPTTTSAPTASLFYKLAYGAAGTYQQDVYGWYWGAADGAAFSIDGHRAWLAVPRSSAAPLRFLSLSSDTKNVATMTESLCDEPDIVYDLQGRRVTAPVRGGLYIINGKKQYIK